MHEIQVLIKYIAMFITTLMLKLIFSTCKTYETSNNIQPCVFNFMPCVSSLILVWFIPTVIQ